MMTIPSSGTRAACRPGRGGRHCLVPGDHVSVPLNADQAREDGASRAPITMTNTITPRTNPTDGLLSLSLLSLSSPSLPRMGGKRDGSGSFVGGFLVVSRSPRRGLPVVLRVSRREQRRKRHLQQSR